MCTIIDPDRNRPKAAHLILFGSIWMFFSGEWKAVAILGVTCHVCLCHGFLLWKGRCWGFICRKLLVLCSRNRVSKLSNWLWLQPRPGWTRNQWVTYQGCTMSQFLRGIFTGFRQSYYIYTYIYICISFTYSMIYQINISWSFVVSIFANHCEDMYHALCPTDWFPNKSSSRW